MGGLREIRVAILKDFYFFAWDYKDYIEILSDYKWKGAMNKY